MIFSFTVSRKRQERNSRLKKGANAILSPIIFVISILQPIVSLLVSFLYPQLHYFKFGSDLESESLKWLPGFWSRILSTFESLVGMTPVTFVFGPLFAVEMLALLKLNESVQNLTSMNSFKEKRLTLCMAYRKLQIFVNLVNEYGKDYLRPDVEFMGSVNMIVSAYFLISLKSSKFDRLMGNNEQALMNSRNLAIFGRVIFSIFLIAIVLCISCLFELASKPYLRSKRILHILRNSDAMRRRGWERKFFLSCQPIGVKIGNFHVIDQERVPLILQYCLRRIFYLTVQSG